MPDPRDGVLKQIEADRDEMVNFAAELVRIPTVNPPGELYPECAEFIGRRFERHGLDVAYVDGEGRPEHTTTHPRINVIGRRSGASPRPLVHLNGHMDVVPPGAGWTVEPFCGEVRDGRLYGRGSSDMKAGFAAAVYAVEAIRRAGLRLEGGVELSATVDEETGGYAGMARLAQRGMVHRDRTDYVIIPEPLGVDRICTGHRGVYWFKITARGRTAHGSMPFLGQSAIESIAALIEAIRNELAPALAERRTAMPVIPLEARKATININSILGGQGKEDSQSPCVADRCEAVFDRRFLPEEGFESTRDEINQLVERISDESAGRVFSIQDILVVHPVETPEGSPLTAALAQAIADVRGAEPGIVASPGTYDHKHVAHIAGIEHCVAYGPGVLELAHQADEYCRVADMVDAAKVLALGLISLLGIH
jgi:succinyl-diaminopimelate desuccinylase